MTWIRTVGVLPWPQIDYRLRASRTIWLASTRPGGRPHQAPVWFLWHGQRATFTTGRLTRRGRNLHHENRVVPHLGDGAGGRTAGSPLPWLGGGVDGSPRGSCRRATSAPRVPASGVRRVGGSGVGHAGPRLGLQVAGRTGARIGPDLVAWDTPQRRDGSAASISTHPDAQAVDARVRLDWSRGPTSDRLGGPPAQRPVQAPPSSTQTVEAGRDR